MHSDHGWKGSLVKRIKSHVLYVHYVYYVFFCLRICAQNMYNMLTKNTLYKQYTKYVIKSYHHISQKERFDGIFIFTILKLFFKFCLHVIGTVLPLALVGIEH